MNHDDALKEHSIEQQQEASLLERARALALHRFEAGKSRISAPEIQRELDLTPGEAKYALGELQAAGIIDPKEEGKRGQRIRMAGDWGKPAEEVAEPTEEATAPEQPAPADDGVVDTEVIEDHAEPAAEELTLQQIAARELFAHADLGPGEHLVIDHLSNENYHGHYALGSTSLKTLATGTPAEYQWKRTHPKHSTAFDVGTAAHSLILEDDADAFEVIDVHNKQLKAWKEGSAAAREEGKTPITAREWEHVKGMRDSVMQHRRAREILTGHIPERSFFRAEDDGLQIKVRPDALNLELGIIGDLKTTVNADPRNFGRTAANFGYHQSAALYQDELELITGEHMPFLFINVEKEPPYLVSVVPLHPTATALGRELNERGKNTFRFSQATGIWPGYPEVEPVRLPRYAEYQTNELLEGDE